MWNCIKSVVSFSVCSLSRKQTLKNFSPAIILFPDLLHSFTSEMLQFARKVSSLTIKALKVIVFYRRDFLQVVHLHPDISWNLKVKYLKRMNFWWVSQSTTFCHQLLLWYSQLWNSFCLLLAYDNVVSAALQTFSIKNLLRRFPKKYGDGGTNEKDLLVAWQSIKQK